MQLERLAVDVQRDRHRVGADDFFRVGLFQFRRDGLHLGGGGDGGAVPKVLRNVRREMEKPSFDVNSLIMLNSVRGCAGRMWCAKVTDHFPARIV